MKTRRWFQIHLSTAVVLMFAAGGLMWLNFEKRKGTPYNVIYVTPDSYGWPLAAYVSLAVRDYDGPIEYMPGFDNFEFVPTGVAVDAFFGVLLLVGVAAVLEWHARRNDKRIKKSGARPD